MSSKYLTAFSDFRLPRDAPDFVTPAVYVQYLRDYLKHFSLWPHVRCSTRVTRIVRRQPSGHTVTTTTTSVDNVVQTTTWDCDAVAICTGIHVLPSIPDIPGMERVPTVLHSSQLKTRSQFGADAHVVVLGAGETGMDMAHLAVTAPTASVTLCHRGGFFCAPKVLLPPIYFPFRSFPMKSRRWAERLTNCIDHTVAQPARTHAQERRLGRRASTQQTRRHVRRQPL